MLFRSTSANQQSDLGRAQQISEIGALSTSEMSVEQKRAQLKILGVSDNEINEIINGSSSGGRPWYHYLNPVFAGKRVGERLGVGVSNLFTSKENDISIEDYRTGRYKDK